jgi:hypothetical protein
MAILDLVTLPAKLAVAAVDATLALGQLSSPDGPIRRPDGYADRVMLLIGRGGLVERVAATLSDPHGPVRLVNAVAAVVDQDRPLGRALAPGGTLDRLFAADGPLSRLVDEGGALDTLVAHDGPLERLLATEGALDRITRPGGALDRLLQEDGLLDRLLSEDGFLDKLVADGGTLDQLIDLGATLERISPRLAELSAVIPQLQQSVTTLNHAVGPLGELANRLPRGLRRPAALES